MGISNFSSILEILFAANIAYVISDEFAKPGFVALITDKILKKYEGVTKIISDIDSEINAIEVSFANIPDPKDGDLLKSQIYLKRRLLDQQKTKSKQFKTDINHRIKLSFRTRLFSVLCFYLTLYCFFILFSGGILHKKFSSDITCIWFSIFSFLPLVLSWIYDSSGYHVDLSQGETSTKETWRSRRLKGFFKFIFGFLGLCGIKNGYKFCIAWFLFSAITSIILSFTELHVWLITNTYFEAIGSQEKYYNTIRFVFIQFVIMLPVINFIVYFTKASIRGENNKEDLTKWAQTTYKEIKDDLTEIEKLIIGHEVYVEAVNVKVEDEKAVVVEENIERKEAGQEEELQVTDIAPPTSPPSSENKS
jgi:hypothetical protein